MSKKFTEEQYQKIVDLQEIDYKFSILEDNGGLSFWRGLINVEPDLAVFVGTNKLLDELAALANPLTREWAHEQFVEKEKKYYWYLKSNNDFGLQHDGITINIALNKINELTKSEIREWGYNPEMFDKEEVD